MNKECRHCGIDFDPSSPWKRQTGGYINECPSCVEEAGGDPTPVIRGYGPPGGEAGELQIVKFKSAAEADEFTEAYNNPWLTQGKQLTKTTESVVTDSPSPGDKCD